MRPVTRLRLWWRTRHTCGACQRSQGHIAELEALGETGAADLARAAWTIHLRESHDVESLDDRRRIGGAS